MTCQLRYTETQCKQRLELYSVLRALLNSFSQMPIAKHNMLGISELCLHCRYTGLPYMFLDTVVARMSRYRLADRSSHFIEYRLELHRSIWILYLNNGLCILLLNIWGQKLFHLFFVTLALAHRTYIKCFFYLSQFSLNLCRKLTDKLCIRQILIQ